MILNKIKLLKMENMRFSVEIKRLLNKIKTTKKLIKFNFKIDLFLQKGNNYIDIFVIIVVLTIDKSCSPPPNNFLHY